MDNTIISKNVFLFYVTYFILINLTNSSEMTTQQDPLPLICGLDSYQLNNYSNSNRIIGGIEARASQLPWQAFLIIQYYEWGIISCGGTLISDRWILTAAHCLDGFYHQRANNIDIFLGVLDTSHLTIKNLVGKKAIKKFESHIFHTSPQWEDEETRPLGDIALIQLPITIEFSESIRPICLPKWDDIDHVGHDVIVSGWGKTANASSGSDFLMVTNTTVLPKDSCSQVYGPDIITEDIICGEADNKHGICQGDSGGPMSYQDPISKIWSQIGVISFVSIRGCESGEPNGFTKVQSHLDWIYRTTGLSNPNPNPATTRKPTSTSNRHTNFSPNSSQSLNKSIKLLIIIFILYMLIIF